MSWLPALAALVVFAGCSGSNPRRANSLDSQLAYLNELKRAYPSSRYFLGVGEGSTEEQTPAQALELANLNAIAQIARAMNAKLSSVAEGQQIQRDDSFSESMKVTIRAEAELDPVLLKHIKAVPNSQTCGRQYCRIARFLSRAVVMRVYGERYEALRRNFRKLARRAKAVPSARFAAPYRLASIAYKRMQTTREQLSLSEDGDTFRRGGLADDAVWSSVLALRDRYASEVMITLNVTGPGGDALEDALLGVMGQVFSKSGMSTKVGDACKQGLLWSVDAHVQSKPSRLMGIRCKLMLRGELRRCSDDERQLRVSLQPSSLGFGKARARQLSLVALGPNGEDACGRLVKRITFDRMDIILRRALGQHLPL